MFAGGVGVWLKGTRHKFPAAPRAPWRLRSRSHCRGQTKPRVCLGPPGGGSPMGRTRRAPYLVGRGNELLLFLGGGDDGHLAERLVDVFVLLERERQSRGRSEDSEVGTKRPSVFRPGGSLVLGSPASSGRHRLRGSAVGSSKRPLGRKTSTSRQPVIRGRLSWERSKPSVPVTPYAAPVPQE